MYLGYIDQYQNFISAMRAIPKESNIDLQILEEDEYKRHIKQAAELLGYKIFREQLPLIQKDYFRPPFLINKHDQR